MRFRRFHMLLMLAFMCLAPSAQARMATPANTFRVNDANVSRWLSEDPIGEEGGLNLYGYVGNGPIGTFDPLGLDPPVPPENPTWAESFHYHLIDYPAYSLGTAEGLSLLIFGDPNSTALAGTPIIGLGKGPPDPKQISSAIRKIGNILNKGIKPGSLGDIAGASCDQVSNPIWNPLKGRWFDHTDDLGGMLRGLRKNAEILKNVAEPVAQSARKAALDMISEIERAFHGLGL